MHVAAVKSFLGFAHRIGFTRFNAAPLIKLKKAPRQIAQRLLGELDVRHAHSRRPARARPRHAGGRLLRRSPGFGARGSHLGTGHRPGQRGGPAGDRRQGREGAPGADPGGGREALARHPRRRHGIRARCSRPAAGKGGRSPSGRSATSSRPRPGVRGSTRRPRCTGFRHAHASHAIDNGAPITLVSQTLGHADLKTTSVYAHAKPGESSGRYLKIR